MRRTGSEAGFTLLEVLVALAIVALIAAAIAQTANTLNTAARRAELSTTAALLAQSLLERYAAAPALEPGHLQGASPPYAWSIDIEPYGPGSGSATLAKVEVRVKWPPNGAFDLATLRLVR